VTSLIVEQVSKFFGGLRVLSEISFTVAEGETVGIMGANGAGKTTLFSLIAGHSRPSAGDIRLGQRSLLGLSPDSICRLGIARTFQIVKPFGGLSVFDNVVVAALYGDPDRPSQRDAEARASTALAAVGLNERASDLAKNLTLSGQKRLEVARALGTNARFLLLDEVMAGLTPTEVAEMLTMLVSIRRSRALTLLVIEHVMRALMQLSDRILVLHHGELIAAGNPATIARDPTVLRVYYGEDA
jgi:branched-chain amino acid transport system ATP-binding protein